MHLLRLTLVLTLVTSGSDISRLITKLGSPRYAQREEATAELEKLGKDAMPALKLGRHARDPEIRNRAVAIFDKIESVLLTSATPIRVDKQPRSLEQAVSAISTNSGLAIRLLDPTPAVAAQPMILGESGPRPFWEAVEELARSAHLAIRVEQAGTAIAGETLPQGIVTLFAIAPSSKPAPSCVSGPFRVSLTRMIRNIEKSFVTMGEVGLAEPLAADPTPVNRGARRSSDNFVLNLEVMAEPRMRMTIAGPVQLHQVEDNLGNSLIPLDGAGQALSRDPFMPRMQAPSLESGLVSVPLHYPDNPGRVIKVIKGLIPLSITSRKEDPLTISLAEASDKTFRTADTLITIHDVKPGLKLPDVSIDLSIRAITSRHEGLLDQDPFVMSMQWGFTSQIEIADHEGGPGIRWSILSQTTDMGGVRMTIRTSGALSAPTELRFFDLTTASTPAEFKFNDILMP